MKEKKKKKRTSFLKAEEWKMKRHYQVWRKFNISLSGCSYFRNKTNPEYAPRMHCHAVLLPFSTTPLRSVTTPTPLDLFETINQNMAPFLEPKCIDSNRRGMAAMFSLLSKLTSGIFHLSTGTLIKHTWDFWCLFIRKSMKVLQKGFWWALEFYELLYICNILRYIYILSNSY